MAKEPVLNPFPWKEVITIWPYTNKWKCIQLNLNEHTRKKVWFCFNQGWYFFFNRKTKPDDWYDDIRRYESWKSEWDWVRPYTMEWDYDNKNTYDRMIHYMISYTDISFKDAENIAEKCYYFMKWYNSWILLDSIEYNYFC